MSNPSFSVRNVIQIQHDDGFGYQIQIDETGNAVELLYSEDGFKTFRVMGSNITFPSREMSLAVADAISEIAYKIS